MTGKAMDGESTRLTNCHDGGVSGSTDAEAFAMRIRRVELRKLCWMFLRTVGWPLVEWRCAVGLRADQWVESVSGFRHVLR